MLVKVLPEQVEKAWDLLAPMIVQMLPPTLRASQTILVNILRAILTEEAQGWTIKDDNGDAKAFIITTVIVDNLAGSKVLMVYLTYAFATLTKEDYIEAIGSLKRYGLALDCHDLYAYVENDAFLKILGSVGGVKLANLVRL